jgi:hypothetical protein
MVLICKYCIMLLVIIYYTVSLLCALFASLFAVAVWCVREMLIKGPSRHHLCMRTQDARDDLIAVYINLDGTCGMNVLGRLDYLSICLQLNVKMWFVQHTRLRSLPRLLHCCHCGRSPPSGSVGEPEQEQELGLGRVPRAVPVSSVTTTWGRSGDIYDLRRSGTRRQRTRGTQGRRSQCQRWPRR